MSNQASSVMMYCVLRIYIGKQQVLQQFYITNLGEDHLILGYPWFQKFNPKINWMEECLEEGPAWLETQWFTLWAWQQSRAAIKSIREQPEYEEGDEIILLRKTNAAQEWVIAANRKKKTLTMQDIPKEY